METEIKKENESESQSNSILIDVPTNNKNKNESEPILIDVPTNREPTPDLLPEAQRLKEKHLLTKKKSKEKKKYDYTTIGIKREVYETLNQYKPDGVSWNYFIEDMLKEANKNTDKES